MYELRPISDGSYEEVQKQTREWFEKALAKSVNHGEMTMLEESRYITMPKSRIETPDATWARQVRFRNELAKKMIRDQVKEAHRDGSTMAKAGLSTAVGFNFIDLRGPAVFAYPVNTPIRNEMPRLGRKNAGTGVQAQWKASNSPGYVFGGTPEGLRAPVGTPTEKDYFAAYVCLGTERNITFEGQWGGEGYTDNMADEHIRGQQVVFLQEESEILLGNSGLGSVRNGFAFNGAGGSTATTTPTVTAITTALTPAKLSPGGYQCVTGASGSLVYSCLPYTAALTNTEYVSVAVVVLSAMGNPCNSQYGYCPVGATPSITNGLTPSYTYNAPGTGTTVTVNGGMSKISPLSTPVEVTTGNLSVTASVAPYTGAFGYAWFVYVASTSAAGTLASAYLAGITTSATAVISGTATGALAGNATGLNVDHSYQQSSATTAGDFDGLITYAATSGYWKDLGGQSFTADKENRVQEIEDLLAYLWTNFQVQPTRFWVSADVAYSLDKAVRYSGAGTGGSFTGMQFIYMRDQQNNVIGGFVVSGYQTRYAVQNPTGGSVIPISVHPMMPTGTLMADFEELPYPASRAPASRALFVERDFYAIEWPLITRAWASGVYVNECLGHYFPFLQSVITNVGPFVGN